jgi:hypothetical protein
MMPKGAVWPDFYIEEADFEKLPLSQDPEDLEGQLADQFPHQTAETPGRFDRLSQQLLWMGRMLRQFRGEPWQLQNYDLQSAWYDYRLRCREQAMLAAAAEREAELAAMPKEEIPTDRSVELSARPESEAPGSAGKEPSEEGGEPAPTLQEPEPPKIIKPERPEGFAAPETTTQISVRQLLGYLALGNSPTDGLARSLAILGAGGDDDVMPADKLYVAIHQLGTRPTPLDEGVGKPWYPLFEEFCEAYGFGEEQPGMSVEKFLAHGRTTAALKRVGKRFVRTDIEKLFPKPA